MPLITSSTSRPSELEAETIIGPSKPSRSTVFEVSHQLMGASRLSTNVKPAAESTAAVVIDHVSLSLPTVTVALTVVSGCGEEVIRMLRKSFSETVAAVPEGMPLIRRTAETSPVRTASLPLAHSGTNIMSDS